MDLWTTNKLAIFIIFVMPGVVLIKIYGLLYPGVERQGSELLIDAIAYSCLNLCIFAIPFSIFGFPESPISPAYFIAIGTVYLLFTPILLAVTWKFFRHQAFLLRFIPHPTRKAWEFVFSQRRPYWVKIVLKDGTRIAGRYAGKSFATSAPCPEQIFLEEAWLLNEKLGFDRIKKGSQGVLVVSNEIAYVEIFKYEQ